MSSLDMVREGAVVSLAYTLRLENGDIVDFSEADKPLEYLHGADNIIPGLERELTGLHIGDKKDVRVEPADGYGDYDPDDIEVVPRTELPADMRDLKLGTPLMIQDEEGNVAEAFVREISTNSVTLDFNHPLAGQPLFFAVEVIGVREATEEEREHGHPHGVLDGFEFEDELEDDFDDEDDDEYYEDDDEDFEDDEDSDPDQP
ncbi:MAG TPA: peptidylprolyl isomerase [Aggregatilineales bacterium]|nr:peptidylprolyl isomerase [Aggregatilineales bacterium]